MVYLQTCSPLLDIVGLLSHEEGPRFAAAVSFTDPHAVAFSISSLFMVWIMPASGLTMTMSTI